MTFQLVVIVSAALFWLWGIYRVTHPFVCNCGYKTIIGPWYVRHLMKVHRPVLK